MEHYIGIDIGGTEVKGALWDGREVVRESREPTRASQGAGGIIRVVADVFGSLSSGGVRVRALGIGSAGRINASSGDVVYATDNLPGWMGLNIPRALGLDIPVFVDNDANAALLGEHWLGAARGYESAVMLTLGTGVGGGNLFHGRIMRGATWNGGEWGHVILFPGGHPCNCGHRGCVEQYLSGTALTRMARERISDSIRHGSEVWRHYAQGAAGAVEVVDEYLSNLATLIYSLHTGINPACFVLGGGVVESRDAFWDRLQARLRDQGVPVPVVPAALGNRAGYLGAVKMAMDGVTNREA